MAQGTARNSKNKELERNIREQLSWDASVHEEDIDITASNGTVTLKGSVPSFYDREHAGVDAFATPGVKDVDNRLIVSSPGKPAAAIDAEIRSRIRRVLSWSGSIDASKIRVSSKNGVVTFDGTVDAYWKKIRIGDLAAIIAGVVAIKNRIAIVPTRSAKDEKIAKAVVAALVRNEKINVNAIDVEVENGSVILSGTAPDTGARRSVEETVSSVAGVTSLNNSLILI